MESIVEVDFQIIAQVCTAPRLLTSATTERAAEDRLENIANVRETSARAATTATAAHALLERFVAEPVVSCALLRVLQDFVGFADGLEASFGIAITGVLVRVPAHRQLAIRRFDHGIVRAAFNL